MPTYFDATSNTATNVAVSFQVSGTSITGSANIQGPCSTGGSFGEGFVGAISGTVAADGTFTAGFTSNSGNIQTLTITGTAPSSAQESWNGKLTLNITNSPSLCPASIASSFTATAVPQVSGTFTGSGPLLSFAGATAKPPAAGSIYSVSTDLSQSGPADAPLTGVIQMTGIPCFTRGTTSSLIGSTVEDNVIIGDYTMEDGASVLLLATINNTADTQLSVAVFNVSGDSCAGNYYFTTGASNSLLLNR